VRGGLLQLGPDACGQHRRIGVHLADDLGNDAFALLDERQQKMLGRFSPKVLLSSWPRVTATFLGNRNKR
jgi:hypothetical protein